MFKGLIVTGPDCAGLDCAGPDSVGPDCAGPDRTCTDELTHGSYLLSGLPLILTSFDVIGAGLPRAGKTCMAAQLG